MWHTRTLDLTVDATTFPGKKIPASLSPTGPIRLNIAQAMLMLGTVSVPGGFSTASPARYWAWLRYLSAVSRTPDLRITPEFADLDPHQKTILSDDFGVAVCTKLLYDRLGGLQDVIDGRKFILQYASLVSLPKRAKKKLPKVGGGKCPDYVLLDSAGKWHVLECKGTQTSPHYRKQQLKTAVAQKFAIQVKRTIAGERMAAGLFLAHEHSDLPSSVHIVDPEPNPYVTIAPEDLLTAAHATRRLAVSRALGLAGFAILAEELSIPPELRIEDTQFLSPEERRRTNTSVNERFKSAIQSLSTDESPVLEVGHEEFVGQRVSLDLPRSPYFENGNVRRIELSMGVDRGLIDDLRHVDTGRNNVFDQIEARAAGISIDGIHFEETDSQITLRCGQLFSARMVFS